MAFELNSENNVLELFEALSVLQSQFKTWQSCKSKILWKLDIE